MQLFVLPFPNIDPVAFSFGPLAVRWYALAYIFGLLGSWAYGYALAGREHLWRGRPHPTPESLSDLLLYGMLGTIVGGRLGQVVFYEAHYYVGHPLEIFALWNGGMSFHGGLIGVVIAIWYFSWRRGFPVLSTADLCAAAAPIPILLVRIANFIQQEHAGRPTDVPWAVVFPDLDGTPRHPSQLYEGLLEGLVLFLVLAVVARKGALRWPGLLSGLFTLGYALARIAMEFFREPDPDLERLGHGLTMGMLLSLPLAALGIALLIHSARVARRQLPLPDGERVGVRGARAVDGP
jgi:phosphatidylglycerol:prolipoprotein diacylglycerol transferase